MGTLGEENYLTQDPQTKVIRFVTKNTGPFKLFVSGTDVVILESRDTVTLHPIYNEMLFDKRLENKCRGVRGQSRSVIPIVHGRVRII